MRILLIISLFLLPVSLSAQSYYGTGVKNYQQQKTTRQPSTYRTIKPSNGGVRSTSSYGTSSQFQQKQKPKYGNSLIGQVLSKHENSQSSTTAAPFSNKNTGDGTLSGFMKLLGVE